MLTRAASLYVFWTVCGLQWVIWAQQTGGNADRSASNAIATHLRQEEGAREETLTDIKRNTDGGSARIWKPGFGLKGNPREKARDRRKVSKKDEINVRSRTWMGQKISWCQLKGNSPWQRERAFVWFQVTLLHFCSTWNTQEGFFSNPNNWKQSQRRTLTIQQTRSDYICRSKYRISLKFVQIPVIKIKHVPYKRRGFIPTTAGTLHNQAKTYVFLA